MSVDSSLAYITGQGQQTAIQRHAYIESIGPIVYANLGNRRLSTDTIAIPYLCENACLALSECYSSALLVFDVLCVNQGR